MAARALLLVLPANAAIGPSVPPEITMADALPVVAAAWGVMMAIAPILQIRRMLERRSSADVSLSYLAVLLIGFVLWAAYGVSLGNMALILPNSVALIVGVATLVIAYRLRGRRPTP